MEKKIIIALLFLFPFSAFSNSINEIKDKGYVSCGIYRDSDILNVDTDGFEAVLCKLFAVAIFKIETAVEIVPLDGELRWDALYDGTVDILYAAPTWTLERDIEKKSAFL